MGIIRGGVLGGFRNKTGAVVGSYWRTLDVIKGLPRISGKAPTVKQLDQQMKFGLVTKFLSYVSQVIDTGFKSVSSISTPINVAVSYHLKYAITGISPNFAIDYAKVRVSTGKLELPVNIEVATVINAKLDFDWDHLGADDKYMDATDRITLAVYSPMKGRWGKAIGAAARSAMAFQMQLPLDFQGDTVHVYASFHSVKTPDLSSHTKYVGSMVII